MSPSGLARTVRIVALLNLGYFGVEAVGALAIGSVALFADSIDFLEDASLNLLVAAALTWTAATRARVGMGLAALLVVPSAGAAWMAWRKLAVPVVPDPETLSLLGFGALLVNVTCALMLARYRAGSQSLTRAAFLSARNDVVANLATIGAGLVTALWWRSAWPDLLVGIGILVLNAGSAHEVWTTARAEARAALSV